MKVAIKYYERNKTYNQPAATLLHTPSDSSTSIGHKGAR